MVFFLLKEIGLFNWLPVFIVQTAKIQNKTEYYVEFQFNRKPNIDFIYPLNDKFNLSVHAWDIDGHITKVEFYSTNQLLGAVSTAPYVFEWCISRNGIYNITAKAYDNLNAINESKTVIINVISAESGIDTAMSMIENDECLI